MFDIGVQELLVILAIVALLFGPSRLPQVGDGVGKMIAGFRKSMREANDEPEPDDALPASEAPPQGALPPESPERPAA